MTVLTIVKYFAIGAHGVQKRHYDGEAYWHHLQRVAATVFTYSNDIETMAAAWLHDVIEDTPFTAFDLQEHFSENTVKYVSALTDFPVEYGNRAKRKAAYVDQLAAAGMEVHTIKCADIIDNYHSIAEYDPDFEIVYKKELERMIPVLDKAPPKLYNRVIDEVFGGGVYL